MSLRNYFILASIAICAVVNSVGAIPSPSEPTTLGEQTLERRDFYGAANNAYDIAGLAKRSPQVVMLSQMTQGSGPSFGMSQVVAATKEWMRLLHSQETEILIICNAFPTDARVTDAMAALGAGQDYANAIIDIRSATNQATARSKFNIALTYRSPIEAAIRTLVNIANSA
ncbi:hypothetical protein Pst134EA_029279 [Puccinia striiformis f. sp. tritici]|uniref:hypothetical protein n=1 Tax=Puccinia striiformis f. sp. tritici TaxID=168172 RepID=UPI002008C323|nr:hypothetical protein Pst134EA_029279 [Puccinia striiformis f. sp. tritici]KAH9447246.1 hypothetical protein Pst134EA_029279 [Puccinia striiformis f. sp. tritici]